MRIEDVLLRHMPVGGELLDMRLPEFRTQLSLLDDSGIAPVDSAEQALGPLTVLCNHSGLGQIPVQTATTILLLSINDPQLADVLDWATTQQAQLVELNRIAAPPATVAVITHGRAPQVPTIPATGDDVPADPLTWKRLGGELVLQRFTAAELSAQNDELQRQLRTTRRKFRKLRDESSS